MKNLEQFEEAKINGQRLRAKVRWREYGDSCNIDFFKAVKAKYSNTKIFELG
jgi:hypothetical protein